MKIDCPICRTPNEFSNMNDNDDKENTVKNIECKLITCTNNLCGNKFIFYKCEYCFDFIFWNSKEFETNGNSLKMLEESGSVFEYEKEDENYLKDSNPEKFISKVFKNFISAQSVKCNNNTCNRISSKIECPYCNEKRVFYREIENNLQDANTYICMNFKCNKSFYINSCPTCHEHCIVKNKRNSNEYLECPNKINSNNNNINNNDFCKNYDYIKCVKCLSLFYFFEGELNKNKILKCPLKFCQEKFINFKFNCGAKKLIKEENLKGISIIKCPDIENKCVNKITYCNICNFYFDNLIISDEFPKNSYDFICLNKNCENFYDNDSLIKANNNHLNYIAKNNKDNFMEDALKSFNILKKIDYKKGKNCEKADFYLIEKKKKNFQKIEEKANSNLKYFYEISKTKKCILFLLY